MAKPICVIRLLEDSAINRPDIHKINDAMQYKMPDYHVFVLPMAPKHDGHQDPIQFQVFHEKDFTEIQYNDLKELIQSQNNG